MERRFTNSIRWTGSLASLFRRRTFLSVVRMLRTVPSNGNRADEFPREALSPASLENFGSRYGLDFAEDTDDDPIIAVLEGVGRRE